MPTFIETFLGEVSLHEPQQEFYLAADNPENTTSKTASIGQTKSERVPKDELEDCYRIDAFIFNAVNVGVQMIMSAGHTIKAKKASVRKFFENFVENISQVGADTTWNEILARIYQDCYIYGGSWDELVWNRADTKPVDLKTLDPKEMDFARDEKGNIVLDQNEKPIGYVQTLPFGIPKEGYGDEAPAGVAVGDNKIFIDSKRIAYIPLYTFGSGFEGIGKVESAYQATIWKLNLLKAGAESSSRRGFSPVIAKVGNENVHPTPQMIDNILESLKKLDYSKYMSLPWYVDLTTLDVKSIETYEGFLKYLTAMQSAALGIPVPFVTGLGEETNRSTLGTQLEVLKLSLDSIAEKVSRSIEKYIFRPIAEAEGFDEVPQLVWNKVTLNTEVASGLKKPKSKDEEDDEDEEEDDMEKEPKKLFTASSQSGGQPLDTSHQNQGISYPSDMKKKKKVKIKSPKK